MTATELYEAYKPETEKKLKKLFHNYLQPMVEAEAKKLIYESAKIVIDKKDNAIHREK